MPNGERIIKKANQICDICNDGCLTIKKGFREIEYGNKKGIIEYQYSTCSDCGIEQASDDDLVFNNVQLKKIQSLMYREHE